MILLSASSPRERLTQWLILRRAQWKRISIYEEFSYFVALHDNNWWEIFQLIENMHACVHCQLHSGSQKFIRKSRHAKHPIQSQSTDPYTHQSWMSQALVLGQMYQKLQSLWKISGFIELECVCRVRSKTKKNNNNHCTPNFIHRNLFSLKVFFGSDKSHQPINCHSKARWKIATKWYLQVFSPVPLGICWPIELSWFFSCPGSHNGDDISNSVHFRCCIHFRFKWVNCNGCEKKWQVDIQSLSRWAACRRHYRWDSQCSKFY